MKVQRCENKGRPAFRWGDQGYAYPYDPADEVTRNRAYCLAARQNPDRGVVIQHFQAAPFHLSEAEIAHMVDESKKEAIKGKQIKAFAIAHDGKVSGKVVGVGGTAIKYLKDAIRKIHSVLGIGTKVFDGHNADNSHEGRKPIGQVVGKALRTVGDRLFNVALVAFDGQDRSYDNASIEAMIAYDNSHEGPVVRDVRQITGIALGSASRRDKPGFPGATLLGAFQAFREDHAMKIEEIMAAIAEGGYKVTDVFSDKEILGTDLVKEHVKAEKQTKHEHARRVEEKLGEANAALEKANGQIADLEGKLSKAGREVLSMKTTPILETALAEGKVDEKRAGFIRKQFGNSFTLGEDATDEAAAKKAVAAFIETQTKEFDALAGFFSDSENKGGSNPPMGVGGDGNTKPSSNPNDLTKPENNPAIPQVV